MGAVQRQGTRKYIHRAHAKATNDDPRETLDAEPVGLGMGTTFFPGIDTTGPELHAFIGIEPTSDHPENALLDSIEYFVGHRLLNGCGCWYTWDAACGKRR